MNESIPDFEIKKTLELHGDSVAKTKRAFRDNNQQGKEQEPAPAGWTTLEFKGEKVKAQIEILKTKTGLFREGDIPPTINLTNHGNFRKMAGYLSFVPDAGELYNFLLLLHSDKLTYTQENVTKLISFLFFAAFFDLNKDIIHSTIDLDENLTEEEALAQIWKYIIEFALANLVFLRPATRIFDLLFVASYLIQAFEKKEGQPKEITQQYEGLKQSVVNGVKERIEKDFYLVIEEFITQKEEEKSSGINLGQITNFEYNIAEGILKEAYKDPKNKKLSMNDYINFIRLRFDESQKKEYHEEIMKIPFKFQTQEKCSALFELKDTALHNYQGRFYKFLVDEYAKIHKSKNLRNIFSAEIYSLPRLGRVCKRDQSLTVQERTQSNNSTPDISSTLKIFLKTSSY